MDSKWGSWDDLRAKFSDGQAHRPSSRSYRQDVWHVTLEPVFNEEGTLIGHLRTQTLIHPDPTVHITRIAMSSEGDTLENTHHVPGVAGERKDDMGGEPSSV